MHMDRKAQLINIGAELAAKHGLVNVTRRMVAKKARVTDALVTHHVGNNDAARKLYKAHMKKLGLKEPAKEVVEAMGLAMRARGKRTVATKRARTIREVAAIRRNIAEPTVSKAARLPKLPPAHPVEVQ